MPAWVGPVARQLLVGLKETVLLTVWASLASIAFGFLLGLLSTLGGPLRLVIRAYVEFWRALPVLVSLFFVYYGLPALHITVTTSLAAIIGLALWGSANVSEITRGAVQSVPRSQLEAANALGMRWYQAMILVIIPQAVRRMIPSTVGTITTLIQGTALVSALGVLELTEAGSRQIARLSYFSPSSHALSIMGAILLIYFAITFPLVYLSRVLERRIETQIPQRKEAPAGRELAASGGA